MPAVSEATPQTQEIGGARPIRRSHKGRRTRERILDAGEAVFADKGFEGATLREVATRVGLRIPSLYNHFSCKEALYAAVLERGIGPIFETLAASAVREEHDGDEVLTGVLAVLVRRPNLPRLVLHETLAGGHHLRGMLRRWLGPVLRESQRLVERGPGAQRFDPEQLPHLVLALYNVVVGYFAAAPLYRDLDGTDLLSPEALERQADFMRRLTSILFAPAAPAERGQRPPEVSDPK
jgi:AcrR family transcriptional regulator